MLHFRSAIKLLFPIGSHKLSKVYFDQVGKTLVIKLLSVALSLIYVPLVLEYLNQEKYGIWVTLNTIVNWIRILDIGLGNGLRNKLSESIAQKKDDKSRIYVSTTYGILGGIFFAVLLFFYLVNPYINWAIILNTKLLLPNELLTLTNIAISLIIIGFIVQTVTLVYTAHGNTAIAGFLQLIISLISLILIGLATIFTEKGNIIILASIITGVPVLIYFIFSIYTFYFKYPHLCPSFSFIRIKESSSLLKLSIQFFILQITALIIYSSTPFLITQLFSPNEVTIFNIANSIFNLPIMIIGIITLPVLPLVSQAFAIKDNDWLRKMLKKQLILASVISLGTLVMIFLSPIIYKLWIGNKVIIPFRLSLTLGVFAIIQVINTPFSTFLNGIGKIWILVILSPIGIVIFLGSSIILSRLFNDLIGISIALSLTSLIGLIVTPLKLKKILKRNYNNN